MNIDPATFSFAQNAFLEHINFAMHLLARYATNLLYLLTTIEITVLGLLWSLQHDIHWGRLFFKVLQIGLIVFLIDNYHWILDAVIKSFAGLGGAVVNTKDLTEFIFNPALVWQYGYDVSLGLLKAAALGSAFGLILIQIILGFGILLVFGLLGIQSVLQIVGFYLVAFLALLLAPLGIFTPTLNMLENSVQSVFKAGVRVMTIIIVMGMAMLVFGEKSHYDNISQLLGLFFTALLFLCLAIRLPNMLADVVGKIKFESLTASGDVHFRNHKESSLQSATSVNITNKTNMRYNSAHDLFKRKHF